MDALELLEMQHTEVDETIELIKKSKDRGEREDLFGDLADNLAAHATVEETIFYPACMAKKTKDMLIESVEEHLQIKRLLADMMKLDVMDDHFDAKLEVLGEELEHHAHEEEEDELFPLVRKAFSNDELEALGAEMEAKFEELMEGAPRESIPAETSSAAPI